MGHPQLGVLDLPLPRFSLELFIDLVDHPQAAGPNRMAKGFQPAVGIYRQLSVQLEDPIVDKLLGLSSRAEAQVFIDDQFRNREAVVDFGEVQFFQRVFDSGLLIGTLGGRDICGETQVIKTRTVLGPHGGDG